MLQFITTTTNPSLTVPTLSSSTPEQKLSSPLLRLSSGSKQCRSTDPENLLSPMAKCKPILVLLKQLFLKLKTETESTRRNLAKLEIYRKFTNTLAVSVLLSIAWIGFELYFNATDPLSELWQIAWIIPAFWSLLSYTLLLVICVLWAPSRNPTRYVLS
ncbi:hypothetical protein KIW84_012900 [Lathyrus oleraceus]|uniref:GOST seven transmembrane domain-containing protein n=1 Tax=Pisum sativum TaxID=3888 RepID=A0A9D5BIX5_PEA|nr:hypothetical protein KIW84_012900 [Pisum sativum]